MAGFITASWTESELSALPVNSSLVIPSFILRIAWLLRGESSRSIVEILLY